MKIVNIGDYVMWGICAAALIAFILSPETSKFAACCFVVTTAIWVGIARMYRHMGN